MASSKRTRSRKNTSSSAESKQGDVFLNEAEGEEQMAASDTLEDNMPSSGDEKTPAMNPVRSIPVRGSLPENMERIGDILRRVRVHRGEDLEGIADYLRIRPSFLAALEASHYEELPADAYVIGFLRTYANYLGLDGKGAIDQYRREMAGRRRKPQLSMPQPVSEGRAPTVAMIVGAVIAFLLLYGLWYGISSSNRAAVVEPPLPVTQSIAPEAETPAVEGAINIETNPVAEPTPAVTAAPPSQPEAKPPVKVEVPQAVVVPPVAPAVSVIPVVPPSSAQIASVENIPVVKAPVYGDTTGSSRIVIKAVADSWVLVADARGNTVFDRTMKPGESYRVPTGKTLTLTTGNAGGLEVSVDGQDVPKLGDAKRVVRALPLEADKLKAIKP